MRIPQTRPPGKSPAKPQHGGSNSTPNPGKSGAPQKKRWVPRTDPKDNDSRPGNRPVRGRTAPEAEVPTGRAGRQNPYARPERSSSPTGRPQRKSSSPIRIKGDLLFGRNAIIEALKGRRTPTRLWLADGIRDDERIDILLDLARHRTLLIDTVPRHLLDDLTEGANHQGVAMEAAEFPYVDLEDIIARPGTILVLDHLHDPQNFGTLIRAADAAGVAGIVLPSDRSVSVTPAVVNASAGAVEHLSVAIVPNLGRAVEKIEESGRWIVGLDSGEGSIDLFETDLPTPVALVIGSEGPGLTKNIRERCQIIASLPMQGKVASLNAATAGSIALFDVVRRERAAGISRGGDEAPELDISEPG